MQPLRESVSARACPARRNHARPHAARFQCEPLEDRRLLAAGGLDPSFGDAGQAFADFGKPITTTDVTVQTDGKTVVVGYNSSAHDGFYVARFNVDGTPDTGFGPDHNGKLFTSFESDSRPYAVAIDNDSEIVVAGQANDSDTAVVRYNLNGSLDTTFDGDGKVIFGTDGDATMHGITFQSDGKILLGGEGVTGNIFNSNDDLIAVRLNPNGSHDDSFGGDGEVIHGFGGYETFAGMTVDYRGNNATNPSYGKIVVAGSRDGRWFLTTRWNADGSLDSSYDAAHSLVPAPGQPLVGAYAMVMQEDGKVVVAGNADLPSYTETGDYLMARFKVDGGIDTSFGIAQNGWVRTDMGGIDQETDIISTFDGGLVLGGYSVQGQLGGGGTKRNAFAFFLHDGSPDYRFGNQTAKVYAPFGGDGAMAYGPGHRFVSAGVNGNQVHVARFLDVGSNLVYAATLNATAYEQGPVARGFFVYRSERLPYATRVYFNVGGTATAPTFRARNADYTAEGMAFPIPILGNGSAPYVDIAANETFAVVTITPVDDSLQEGNEVARFTVWSDPAYDVGSPSTVNLTIVDNDVPPPTVAQVYVRGSTWRGDDLDPATTSFGEALAASGAGDTTLGFRADNVAAGTTIPWINANQVILRYSSPPTGSGIPTTGGVTLHGLRSDYSVSSLDPLDPSTFVLTLDRALGNLSAAGGGGNDGDQITLTVPGGGPGGAAYALALSVLQGDADRAGGRVSALDLGLVKARINRTSNDPPTTGAQYTPFADANGDGKVNAIDLGAVKARLNHALPAVFAPIQSSVSPLALGAVRDDSVLAQVLL